MVVSKSPKVLASVSQWINRLDRSDNSGTTVRVYPVKFGKADELAKVLTNIFVAHSTSLDSAVNQLAPGSGQVRVDSLDQKASSGGPSTTGTSASQASMGRAVSPIASSFAAFSTKSDNKRASGQGPSSPGGVASTGLFQNIRITADDTNNSLVIYSNQEEYKLIEHALQRIDRLPLQVAIDATIAEVDLTDQLQYGIQYSLTKGSLAALFSTATSVAATTNPVLAAVQPALPGFNLLLGNNAQPNFVLSALSTITKVHVLSAPSIMALDNQPALLQVGDQVPVSTGSATVLSNSNTPIVNTIEMRDTGVILKVLPHIHSNGTIDLEIEQEISSVDATAQPTLNPTIAQRRIHSTVSIASGQTVLLGGLISERSDNVRSGLPIINQIKILGDLLGNTSKNKQRSELIIFVRPTIVRNSVDAGNVSREFRERLEVMRPNNSIIDGDRFLAK